jgi:two-component system LytT family response regulator
MINALIIDDEEESRNALFNVLTKFAGRVNVTGQAGSVAEGVALIAAEKPDVVFLDIRMPDGSGFDLLEQTKDIEYQVIFVTAHDNYALKAIKFSALDYILKPIDPMQVVRAVEKIREPGVDFHAISNKISILLRNKNGFERITLPTFEGLRFVNIKDIIRCEADNNYTFFYLNSGEKFLVTKTLKEYDDILSGLDFIRVHQSHLVNVRFVDRYLKGEGGTVVMVDGSEVSVSRRRKNDFLRMMTGFPGSGKE